MDTEAKEAATDSTVTQLPRRRPLKSARVRSIKASAKKQWRKIWNEGTTTAKKLRRITKIQRKGNKIGPKLYNEIANRKDAATIAQLRTGHCRLNHYLHRFGQTGSPYCECGYGKETVEHYLLECNKYKEQRKRLRKEVGVGKMKVGILLGDGKKIKYMLTFVKETGRLEK